MFEKTNYNNANIFQLFPTQLQSINITTNPNALLFTYRIQCSFTVYWYEKDV